MNTIWKFPVNVGAYTLSMPKGSYILSVQSQHGSPQMWALVDPEVERAPRCFRVYGTGHPIDLTDPCSEFVGTFQIDGGDLIFHLFQEPF